MEAWRQAIRRSDPGEVGRVYYMNLILIFPNGEERTKSQPLTLNPEHGKTIEQVLRKSTEIPGDMRAQLLKKRESDVRLTNGCRLQIILSENPAPDTFGSKFIKEVTEDKGRIILL